MGAVSCYDRFVLAEQALCRLGRAGYLRWRGHCISSTPNEAHMQHLQTANVVQPHIVATSPKTGVCLNTYVAYMNSCQVQSMTVTVAKLTVLRSWLPVHGQHLFPPERKDPLNSSDLNEIGSRLRPEAMFQGAQPSTLN